MLCCNVMHTPEALSSPPATLKTDVVEKGLSGKMILAPLTRGGNLPFRRLCSDFGMEASLSEMIYARSLLKGDAVEQARLRRASNEQFYGVQIATNSVSEGISAIKEAEKAGADFCDLNCGCPIFEATRRGLGSSLLPHFTPQGLVPPKDKKKGSYSGVFHYTWTLVVVSFRGSARGLMMAAVPNHPEDLK